MAKSPPGQETGIGFRITGQLVLSYEIRGKFEAALIIPVEPVCRRGGNILHGMEDTLWDKHFVSRFGNELLASDGQFELARYDGREFVRRMDEIIPLDRYLNQSRDWLLSSSQ